MNGIIDRFENGFAVIELEQGVIHLPLEDAPSGLREGMAVEVLAEKIISIDKAASACRAEMLHRRFEQLKRKKMKP